MRSRKTAVRPKNQHVVPAEGQKQANDHINHLAEKKDGDIFADRKKIMQISTQFYKKLYTTEKLNSKTQGKLLSNIKTKLSQEKQTNLDNPITER